MKNYSKILCAFSLSFFVFSCSAPNLVNKDLDSTKINTQNSKPGFKIASIPLTSSGYNEDAYLLAFEDVRTAIKNGTYQTGYQHYNAVGKNENRLSNQDYLTAKQSVDEGYNEQAYLTAFPDIVIAINNPNSGIKTGYQHYLIAGKSEGRLSFQQYIDAKAAIPVFNEKVYSLVFADAKLAIKNKQVDSGYTHYLLYGITSNRLQNYVYVQGKIEVDNGFSEQAYLTVFPDIAAAVNNGSLPSGLYHYVNGGISEGRLQNSSYIQAKQILNNGFSEQAYLTAFPDIAAAVNNGSLPSGFYHYVFYGVNENRLQFQGYLQAKIAIDNGFSEQAYLIAFPDIAADVNNGSLPSGFYHYIYYGVNEGRLQSSIYIQAKQALDNGFSEQAYLTAFPDIAAAVNNGSLPSGFYHYIYYGVNEGRLQSPTYIQVKQSLSKDFSTGTSISFGNSNKSPTKYVQVTASDTQAVPGTPVTLTATAYNNPGNTVDDSSSNDKWLWSLSSLTPYRGYLDYSGGNTAKFIGSGSAGSVTINVMSKLTGKKSSITLTVPDVLPKITSITPANSSLTLPSADDATSNITLSSNTQFSVSFVDENSDWPTPTTIKTGYERSIGLSGTGISTSVPSSQADNYDIYVGGFTDAPTSYYINNYSYQISGDKKTFTLSPNLVANGTTSSGYLIINARQNGVIKRRMRFNINYIPPIGGSVS